MTDDSNRDLIEIDLTPRAFQPGEEDLVRLILERDLPDYQLSLTLDEGDTRFAAPLGDFSQPLDVLAAHAREVLRFNADTISEQSAQSEPVEVLAAHANQVVKRDGDVEPRQEVEANASDVRMYHAKHGEEGAPISVVLEIDMPNGHGRVLGVG